MTTTVTELVQVDAFELREDDQIVWASDDEVKYVNVTLFERLGNSVRVVTDADTDDELEPGNEVLLVVPVYDAAPEGVTLYKSSGNGPEPCRCVWRLEYGQWGRVLEADDCPARYHRDVED